MLILVLANTACWGARPYEPVRPDPIQERWRWRSFPELKGRGLRCMAEAKDGAMWFGVDAGALRYDGVTWTTYTPEDGLLGAPTETLCVARNGSVYAGSAMGISRFDGTRWQRVFPTAGEIPWSVNGLTAAADGSVWAATGWGILHLRAGTPELYTTAEIGKRWVELGYGIQPRALPAEAVPRRQWPNGLGVIASEHIASEHVVKALAPGGPGERAGLRIGDHIVAVDGDREYTWQQLLGVEGRSSSFTVRRSGRQEPFRVALSHASMQGDFPDVSVWSIFEDRSGGLWAGWRRGEIMHCPGRTAAGDDQAPWRLYTATDGLGIASFPQIAQTPDGEIWSVSGGKGGGLNHFSGGTWESTPFREVPRGSEITPSILAVSDGSLWVGAISGLYTRRGTTWQLHDTPRLPIPSVRITDLLEAADGAIWIAGLGQEVVRLDYGPQRWATYVGLNYQCETADGAQWFISGDGLVVRRTGADWSSYGTDDGLMDRPVALLATRGGGLWAAGSHRLTAATARLDGKRWSLDTHPDLSWSIDLRAVFEASNGTLWFGAAIDWDAKLGHRGGMLSFVPPTGSGRWSRHRYPRTPPHSYGISQSADGTIWSVGSDGLWSYNGYSWALPTCPKELRQPCDGISATRNGELWVGTRRYGAFHYDGTTWTQHDMQAGLAGNSVSAVYATASGSVWARSDEGFSRYDGRAWRTHATWAPPFPTQTRSVRQSRDGTLWFNESPRSWRHRIPADPSGKAKGPPRVRTIRHAPDKLPPETTMTLSASTVSQPGNVVLAWGGIDPWNATPADRIEYSWRLDGDTWSPFSGDTSRTLLSLTSGKHAFEVRARDQDLNVDATPAKALFRVMPPVWMQAWFIASAAFLAGVIAIQTGRVVHRGRKLAHANAGLESRVDERTADLTVANTQLSGAKELLQDALRREEALGRVRDQAIAAFDLPSVLNTLAEVCKKEMAGLGIPVHAISLQLPAEGKPGELLSTVLGEAVAPPPRPRPLDDCPWVREAWETGNPVLVPPERIDAQSLGGIEQSTPIRTILEVPFGDVRRGSVGILIAEPEALGEQAMKTAEMFARFVVLGLRRDGDLAAQRQTEEELSREREHLEERVRERTRELAERVAESERTARDLEASNRELEAFSYSVSHDLRAPLRAVDGFSKALMEDYAERLDEEGLGFLRFLREASQNMGQLIDDLLQLSRVARDPMCSGPINLATVAESVVADLRAEHPEHDVDFAVSGKLPSAGDAPLLRVLLVNLLGNAWKFTGDTTSPRVEIGQTDVEGESAYYVRDNGAGFDMAYADKLFAPFQRLHHADEFTGTGIGLATVQRIVRRHGGRIWAESAPEQGAAFFFTLRPR